MTSFLRQSTAADIALGPFLDDGDGKTAETALSITQPDIRLKKNAANWAQKNAVQTLAHEEFGWYEATLDAVDTNTLGILIVAVHEAGALPVWREFTVVPASIYDGFVTGTLGVPGQVTPPVSGSIADFVAYLFKGFKHKVRQTSTTYELYNAAGTVVDQKATATDDGTAFTRDGVVSGP